MKKTIIIGNLLLSIRWAKSGLWYGISQNDKMSYFIAAYTIKSAEDRAFCFIIGPFMCMIGVLD